MIRKNYSLSAELKKKESKRQGKIQSRQKYLHTLEKLKQVDPIHLYKKLARAKANDANNENKRSNDNRNQKYIKGLESDWEFILKHDLHKEKVQTFLKEQEKQHLEQERQRNKLWGQESVFFNPELNPLGKVPDNNKVSEPVKTPLQNYTLPLKGSLKTNYEPDPLLGELNITPPEGPPPKFYKRVFNTGRNHITTIESSSENYQQSKKPKVE